MFGECTGRVGVIDGFGKSPFPAYNGFMAMQALLEPTEVPKKWTVREFVSMEEAGLFADQRLE